MYFLELFAWSSYSVFLFFFSLFYLSGELLALPNRLDGAGVDWNLAANSSLSLARSLAHPLHWFRTCARRPRLVLSAATTNSCVLSRWSASIASIRPRSLSTEAGAKKRTPLCVLFFVHSVPPPPLAFAPFERTAATERDSVGDRDGRPLVGCGAPSAYVTSRTGERQGHLGAALT